MDEKKLMSKIEGILFAMGDAVSLERLAKAIEVTESEAADAANKLMEQLKKQGRGVRIIEVNGAYQMCTSPEIYEDLVRLAKQPKKYQLTEVLMETLSIIAYKQPVTKAEIEKIRGVSSDHAVNKLVEYDLAQELGRLDVPGRPMLFGTTDTFLRAFGLSSVDELPVLNPVQIEEFKMQAEEEAHDSLFDANPTE